MLDIRWPRWWLGMMIVIVPLSFLELGVLLVALYPELPVVLPLWVKIFLISGAALVLVGQLILMGIGLAVAINLLLLATAPHPEVAERDEYRIEVLR